MRSIVGRSALVLATLTVLLCAPIVAQAQTHPCDTQFPQAATVTQGTISFGFCHSGTDDTNTDPVTSWFVYVDGVKAPLSGVTTSGVANAVGLKLFTAKIQVLQGVHTLHFSAVNSKGEGPKSVVPFDLTVSPPAPPPSHVPASPVNGRVVVG